MSRIYDASLRHINSGATHELERILHSLEAEKKLTCELEINCAGGDIVEGIKMMRIIQKSPVHVCATVVNEAGSTAAVILQCCDTRRMMSDATLHYHYGSWRVSFMVYYDKKLLERNRQRAMDYQEQLIAPIIKRSGMSKKRIHELLRADKKIGAEESLSFRLVDEIL